MKLSCILLLCLVLSLDCYGQNYENYTLNSGIFHTYTGTFGCGGSAFDWDKDGLPDLTLCRKDQHPLFYHNLGNSFEEVGPFIENSGDMKSISWVDYDNDGDPDICVNQFSGSFDLYKNDGNFNFTNVNEIAGFPLTANYGTGHSWIDYNNDSWLDLYICNYNAFGFVTNYFYKNNGDGTFSDVTMATALSNGSRYTFQSTWCDLNHDNYADLHVINDKNTPNSLYRNNGINTFSDLSVPSGLNVIIDAMSNTIGDYDNDGDFDIYVSNNSQGNKLFRSLSNFDFEEVADELEIAVNTMCWGSAFTDLNLDGWKDLVVTTSQIGNVYQANKMFLNNQNGGFSPITNFFSSLPTNSYSLIYDDFDNDGDIDLVCINGSPQISHFWKCSQVNGNYVKISLQGLISNKDAIGSRIELWSSGQYQQNFTFCGEDFYFQSSQYEHFGLGNSEIIDSILISWPSGHKDLFLNLDVNTTHHLIEGSSLLATVNAHGIQHFCETDSFYIHPTDAFDNHTWSNGLSADSILISEPGNYSYWSVSDIGIPVYSDTVEFSEHPIPEINLLITNPSCFGSNDGMIEAIVNGGIGQINYFWDNGASEFQLINLNSGMYSLIIIDSISCTNSAIAELIEPSELLLDAIIENAKNDQNGSINTNVSGGAPPYQYEWDFGSSDASIFDLHSDWYQLTVYDSNNCTATGNYFVENIIVETVIENDDKPSIYPIPADEFILINSKHKMQSACIYDIAGRTIKNFDLLNGGNVLNISEIHVGIYILRLMSNGEYHSFQISITD